MMDEGITVVIKRCALAQNRVVVAGESAGVGFSSACHYSCTFDKVLQATVLLLLILSASPVWSGNNVDLSQDRLRAGCHFQFGHASADAQRCGLFVSTLGSAIAGKSGVSMFIACEPASLCLAGWKHQRCRQGFCSRSSA